MSTDLTEQLRSLAARFDELAPPVTEDDLRTGARPLAPAPTTTAHSSNVRLLAIAAALVVLAGAVWLFSRPSDEPITSVVPASTTTHSTSSSTALSTTIPAVPAADADWFTLRLDGYTAGTTNIQPCCIAYPPPGPPTVAVWAVPSNGAGRFLLVRRFSVTANEQFVYTQSLFLPQADGSSWMFDGIGMSTSERDALAAKVTRDAGGSFVLDQGGTPAAPLASGLANAGQLRAQSYRSGEGTVTLTVGRYRGEFNRFTGGGPMRSVTVAGLPGYATNTDEPSGFVLWKMRDDLWGTLEAPGAIADQLDTLIAALTPARAPANDTTPLLHPELPRQLRTVATVIQVEGSPPMLAWTLRESLPPQGGDIPLKGWNWDEVEGEQTVGAVTWGDSYEVIGTWDGTTFTVTQPPIAATPPTPEGFAFITSGCDELSFTTERESLQAAGSALDHQFNVNVNQINGHCGLTIVATIETAGLSSVLAGHADHIDSVNYLLTAVN